jgi:hypothetical protein
VTRIWLSFEILVQPQREGSFPPVLQRVSMYDFSLSDTLSARVYAYCDTMQSTMSVCSEDIWPVPMKQDRQSFSLQDVGLFYILDHVL